MNTSHALTLRLLLAAVAAASLFQACDDGSAAPPAGPGAALDEPRVLASQNGVLDLLAEARTQRISSMAPFAPTGWVYAMCPRPADGSLNCPAQPLGQNDYGGVRLQLQPGDLLKIRLVNHLPPVTDSDHAQEPGHDYLTLNPINLHTHGMIVSPHYPTVADPTYGDNVFVMTLNPANGPLPADARTHGDVRNGYTDYSIPIPAEHPPGLFWLHPHVHGLALNQVSAGMADIITIGDPASYWCSDAACSDALTHMNVRHILLKDSQVLADGSLQDQEDASFCNPAPAAGAPPWKGYCPGANTAPDGPDYTGGRWFFTLNGQQFPRLDVDAAGGEIWRITNTSGSVSYDLRLTDAALSRNLLMQVLAIDGVAVQPPATATMEQTLRAAGAKLVPEACPGAIAGSTVAGLCTRSLLLMPSSRVEVWVTYRDSSDHIAAPPAGAAAVLQTAGYQTGPDGDAWPAVQLGEVRFGAGDNAGMTVNALSVNAAVTRPLLDGRLGRALRAANAAVGADASCAPLPPGHSRRIFFNAPADEPDAFGLGYEELDAAGNPVPGTFMDVTPFDPDTPTICLPLGPGDTPVHETWQLVNLAGEDHNFHLHQTKFSVLDDDAVSGGNLPIDQDGQSILHDNIPLRHADGTCTTVADWRAGQCTAHPVRVDIPFSVAGDYVYHCHILEHEDGGMMARIRVRPAD